LEALRLEGVMFVPSVGAEDEDEGPTLYSSCKIRQFSTSSNLDYDQLAFLLKELPSLTSLLTPQIEHIHSYKEWSKALSGQFPCKNMETLNLNFYMGILSSSDTGYIHPAWGGNDYNLFMKGLTNLITQLPNLKRLRVVDLQLYDPKKLCAAIKKCSKLEYLSMMEAEDSAEFKLTDFTPIFPSLKRLEVSGLALTTQGVKNLLKKAPKLRAIICNDITEEVESILQSHQETNPEFIVTDYDGECNPLDPNEFD